MIKAPKGQGDTKIELVPAGNHIARLFKIVNIGTVDTGFKDVDTGEPKIQPKVRLYFELPLKKRTYKDKDGNDVETPFVIGKKVTLSLFKGKQVAKLRTIAEAMIGTALTDEEAENFDVESLLGMPCMVQVAHEKLMGSEDLYATIANVSSVPEGLEAPAQVNPSVVLDVNSATQEEIGALNEFIRKEIESSQEYKNRFGNQSL